jgi:hypothetical protein
MTITICMFQLSFNKGRAAGRVVLFGGTGLPVVTPPGTYPALVVGTIRGVYSVPIRVTVQ